MGSNSRSQQGQIFDLVMTAGGAIRIDNSVVRQISINVADSKIS